MKIQINTQKSRKNENEFSAKNIWESYFDTLYFLNGFTCLVTKALLRELTIDIFKKAWGQERMNRRFNKIIFKL